MPTSDSPLPDPAPQLGELERAFLDHTGALLALARRLTRSAAEAEDLVQDTFVKALRAKGQYQPGTNLRAWLLRILRNTFINRYHRGVFERQLLDGPQADPLVDGWVGAASMRALRDPETELLRPVLEQELGAALDALPPDQRMAVVLADVEGMAYREIAEVMSCPVGTVMSRLHRGRRALEGRLLEHARDLGIVDREPGPREQARAADGQAEPASLDAYRARRRRVP